MPNVYTGQVQGLCLTSSGTPSAFCREVLNGTLSIDLQNIRKIGIGSQVHARKGTTEIRLEWTCIGPSAASIGKWFPTTAGTQVSDFPAASTDFLVEVDDGTNGKEWILSGCQPASCKVACSEDPGAEVEYTFAIVATTATLAAAGTDTPAYNAVKGHTINDITVQIGGSAQGALSFALSNDLGARLYNAMDGKASGEHTIATGAVVTTQNPTFVCVTTDEFKLATGTTYALDADTHSDEDITVAMANGTSGEDITITMTHFVPDRVNMPLEAEDLVGFGHEFGLGSNSDHPTLHGRVTVA
jgi:hypothetical protein